MNRSTRAIAATLALVALAACSDRPSPASPDVAPTASLSTLSPTAVNNPAGVQTPPSQLPHGPQRASALGQPVPASVIVVYNGLQWVWASPCALNGGCTSGIDVGHDGFVFATVEQWALRPPISAFRDPDKCAAPWFDHDWNHCDWADAALDTEFHNALGLSTYGSAPAGVGGPAGGFGDPMVALAETWLVRDGTPPTIVFELSTTELWPPNHTMHTVAAGISAVDDTDPNPSVEITVVSSEPDDGLGDGDTPNDWAVIDNGDGTYDVQVRAERAGNGDGRIYTITVTATDAYGNTAVVSGEVSVSHSQGKK